MTTVRPSPRRSLRRESLRAAGDRRGRRDRRARQPLDPTPRPARVRLREAGRLHGLHEPGRGRASPVGRRRSPRGCARRSRTAGSSRWVRRPRAPCGTTAWLPTSSAGEGPSPSWSGCRDRLEGLRVLWPCAEDAAPELSDGLQAARRDRGARCRSIARCRLRGIPSSRGRSWSARSARSARRRRPRRPGSSRDCRRRPRSASA